MAYLGRHVREGADAPLGLDAVAEPRGGRAWLYGRWQPSGNLNNRGVSLSGSDRGGYTFPKGLCMH